MTFKVNSTQIANDEVQITTNDAGNLALEHVPSGNLFEVDNSVSVSDLLAMTSGLSADGTEATLDSLHTEEESVTHPDYGTLGTWETHDIQIYNNQDPSQAVVWRPNHNLGDDPSTWAVPLAIGDPGGIMAYKETSPDGTHVADQHLFEMLKHFPNDVIALANEIPGGSLNIECQDGGSIQFKTGGPDSKMQHFRLSDDGDGTTPQKVEWKNIGNYEMEVADYRHLDSSSSMAYQRVLNEDFSIIEHRAANGHKHQFKAGGNNQLEVDNTRVSANTSFQYPVLSSAPSTPEAGDVVIADGTNWDPDADGNAEKVIYNGTEWIEDTDLQTAL